MAITELSLPIDIPWKRMGVSEDMIDAKAGDLNFPEKWRSSISVFYHEPTELPPEYCNRKITYLKIVCTITNYQVSGSDVTVLNELRARFGDFYAWKAFDARLTQSYPCYGALLQAAIFPNPATGVALHDFPYISAFEPRKREMYEAVTQSGEVASQSSNKINLLKGTTGTDTHEQYNLDLGGGAGGHSGVFSLWSEQHTDPNQQEGTINRYQKQDQDVTTRDASREKRESHSYATNINQLYTLLQGYHLGTNRALFFMQPRPHVQDAKFNFIRGLRRLEGIQEFFLIINRPASVPGICVEIALETAHAYLYRAYQPRVIPLSDLYSPGNLNKTAAALGLDLAAYPDYTEHIKTWNSSLPWIRQETHEFATKGIIPAGIRNLLNDGGMTSDRWVKLQEVTAWLPEVGTEDIALIFEEYEVDEGSFFVTGRRLCSCVTSPTEEELEGEEGGCEQSDEAHISSCDPELSVVWEIPYWGIPNTNSKTLRDTKNAVNLNMMIQDINESLWSSLGSTNRLPYGMVSFLETDFILDEMAQLIRLLGKGGIQDRPLAEIDTLRRLVEKGLGRISKIQSVLGLGTLSTNMITRDLDITKPEAQKIRRELLVNALRELDAKTINPEITPENYIQEKFAFEFPKEKLRDLESSARLIVGPPTTPKVKSELSSLTHRLFRFFYVRDETP